MNDNKGSKVLKCLNEIDDKIKLNKGHEEYEKIFPTENISYKYLYRGQADKEWRLVPSLFREEDESGLETQLLKNFLKDHYLLPEENNFNILKYSDLSNSIKHKEILSLIMNMQHYGVPTRLLDWTLNPLIALFFACNDIELMDKDAKLFIYQTPCFDNNLDRPLNLIKPNVDGKIRLSMIDDEQEMADLFINTFSQYVKQYYNKKSDFEYNSNLIKDSNIIEYKDYKKIFEELFFNCTYSDTILNNVLGFFTEERFKSEEDRFRYDFQACLNLVQPSVIYPKINHNPRTIAQSSAFILHFGKCSKYEHKPLLRKIIIGENKDPVYWNPSFANFIEIKAIDKTELLNELDSRFNINISTVFPDYPASYYKYVYKNTEKQATTSIKTTLL